MATLILLDIRQENCICGVEGASNWLGHSGSASDNPINLGVGMTCKLCRSDRQSKFVAEIGIHFPKLNGLEKPIVWVFPELLVCLHCGNAEFAIPESELRELAKGNAATGGQQDASA